MIQLKKRPPNPRFRTWIVRWDLVNRNAIIGFIFLLVCAAAAWFTVPAVLAGFTSLPPALSGPLAVALGGFIGVLYGKLMDRNSEIRARQREKKAEAYQDFIRAWTSSQKTSNNRSATWEQFVEISRDVMLWASDEVLRQYAVYWRLVLSSKGQVTEPVIRELAKTILAIRKDLEHKNRKVSENDIYTFF